MTFRLMSVFSLISVEMLDFSKAKFDPAPLKRVSGHRFVIHVEGGRCFHLTETIALSATPVHRSLFETIKAACVAAGGVDQDVATEEVAVKELVVTRTRSDGIETAWNPSTMATISILVLCSVLLWRFFVRSPSGDEMASPQVHDLNQIASRMDKLELEMKAVREALGEVLVLLKAQQLATDENL